MSLSSYVVLFVLVALMGGGLPGPGDASLIAAGTLAGEGKLNVGIVLATAMVAWMLGSVAGYEIGIHGGRRLLDHPGRLEKKRRRLLAKGDQAFGRHTFVASATMPAYLSGIFRVRFRVFMLGALVSGIAWIGMYVGLSYVLGEEVAKRIGNAGTKALLGVLLIVAIGLGIRAGYARWRATRRGGPGAHDAPEDRALPTRDAPLPEHHLQEAQADSGPIPPGSLPLPGTPFMLVRGAFAWKAAAAPRGHACGRLETVLPGPGVYIETKLHAPATRREWVDRPALVRYLADATTKVVLVAAPAGFGKTTLVAQWHSSPVDARPSAWVSLDRGDDDPTRLWWHLVCALGRACPAFSSEKILRALGIQAPDFDDVVLPMLVNELAALPEPAVLVLDDYHAVKERRCHDQIASLLLHLPPSVEIVLITRADPPLPLARMRAAGDLVEIRARELRFGPAEAAALVNAVGAAELSEPDLADLVERTEGWPAGVYLAALCLRGQPSPSAFIRQFTGNNRFVVDYLVEDVLSRQPADVRQFLTRTSILARFCAPLCDAVVGSRDAAKIIDVLEKENLFVVPLDEARRWYRYHHLFAQVLRSQLARTEPDIVASLHERASAWHRLEGSADEAIDHAQAAGDTDGAIDLIAHHWYGYVNSGGMATVRGWLRSLGDNTIAASPVAAHCAAWAAALAGDQQSVRHWLPVVQAAQEPQPLPDGMRSPEFSAALLQGAFGFDGIGPMREAAATGVRLETDPMSPWYPLARSAFAYALYLCGEFELAAAQAEEARSGSLVMPMVHMRNLAVLALLAVEAGRLTQAGELACAARDLATDPDSGLGSSPQSSVAYAATGAVYAAQGRLQEARRELDQALRLRRKWAGISPWPTLETLFRLAPVLAELGDRTSAAELLGEARQVLTALPDGADAQLARLERLERRLASRSRPASAAEPLTRREQEVLRLLRGPLSLREVGRQLHLSPNTIKSHARAIYRKLDASDREGAVQKARELGLM